MNLEIVMRNELSIPSRRNGAAICPKREQRMQSYFSYHQKATIRGDFLRYRLSRLSGPMLVHASVCSLFKTYVREY